MIIDGHSHFGLDYYNGKIELEDYVSFAKKNNISIGLLMPPPWPIVNEGVSLLWEYKDNHYNYFSINKNGDKITVLKNPYCMVNEYYKNMLENVNSDDVKLFYVPLIHGLLDEPDYVEKLLCDGNIPAIKFHGFGSGFNPKMVSGEIIEILKYLNIPIIIHTSVYNYDHGYGFDTKFWRNEQHPLKWAKFIIDNQLTGVLNHGACLNAETMKLVNLYDGLMVGLGPDLDISHDYFKVDLPKKLYQGINYLKYLKDKLSLDKILYDVDFNWNEDPTTGLLDNNSINRIIDVFGDESRKILYGNAKSFYKRLK